MKKSHLFILAVVFATMSAKNSPLTCYQCDNTTITSLDEPCENPRKKHCDDQHNESCLKGAPTEGTNSRIYSCANRNETMSFLSHCESSNDTCESIACRPNLCNRPPNYPLEEEPSLLRLACYDCSMTEFPIAPCSSVELCHLRQVCIQAYNRETGKQLYGCWWRIYDVKSYCKHQKYEDCLLCNTSFCNHLTFDRVWRNHTHDNDSEVKPKEEKSAAVVPENNRIAFFGVVVLLFFQGVL